MPIATLVRREPVGGVLTRVVLEVDAAIASTHVRHGQYVELRDDGDGGDAGGAGMKGFFALSSAPRAKAFELIVKPSGAMAERLLAAPEGSRFETSEARGRGFPLDEQRGLPLVLAATGSGIAAIATALDARAGGDDARRTFVLYGVRQRSDVALAPTLDRARAAGVEIAICLSREHAEEPGFFRGYVQEVARAHRWALEGGKIFAAGNPAMLEGLREAAPSIGLRASDVLTNF
jgi:NAD(P)H-flavin reductase